MGSWETIPFNGFHRKEKRWKVKGKNQSTLSPYASGPIRTGGRMRKGLRGVRQSGGQTNIGRKVGEKKKKKKTFAAKRWKKGRNCR